MYWLDELKRKNKAEEKCNICFIEFNEPENRNIRDHCH